MMRRLQRRMERDAQERSSASGFAARFSNEPADLSGERRGRA